MADDLSMTDEPKTGEDGTIEFKEDKEVTKARHDIFIQEIEAMDDYWGSTFRTIYTKEEQEQFMQELDERTREHDKNIERMCNFHYQGFIDSIRELLQVRTEASKLKREVVGVNQELTDASRQLLRHGDALCKARRVQSNIHEGIEALKACLPVLETHARLKKQMAEKRFYPALKTLETLESTMLPKVSGHKFAQVIAASVPKARANIQAAAMSDLKDFLEVVRRESPRIGEVAIRHADEQYGTDPAAEERAANKRHTLAFLGEEPLAPETLYQTEGDEDERVAQELVNFSPVYRCQHIFTALGAKDTFRAYYVKQRQKQAGLALQPPAGMHDTLTALHDYLHGVAGFFVVEDHILNTTTDLVTRTELDQLWASALAKLTTALQSHAACLTDANTLLTFKQLVMVFSHALRNYGFSVQPLHDLLLEVRDHYSEVLMQRWVAVFRDIFDKDNYHQVQVDTTREYEQILQVFPYSSEALEKAPLPRRFPFSLMVPKVYSQVKEFIHSCLRFSDGLNLSQSERDDMLRRSTNVLLTRTLAGCLTTLVRRPGLSLLQLIQVTINTIYLEQASVYLEDVITELTGYNPKQEGGVHSRLQGRSMFKDVRAETEQQIYMQLQTKIDEFLSLAAYDWLLAESDGTASPYLVDLIYFLNSTFTAFTNLPAKVAQTACMSACQHIARGLLAVLLGEEVKQLSLGALQQLNLDVIQCEQFAASEPVAGFEEGALQMCFADLRQLLDLVLEWDWTTYFQEYGTGDGRYGRVSPARAAVIVEKLREADKRNMFSVLKKAERDRKKLQETVLRQLRQLAGKEL
ncbi:exocyst complex component 6B-like [Amphibalanus amphitrite]|uniref:exocyst complex component 6B-like n=1 Tax=Amphibalanus amphitrite TaxID=1232801 RepID=UPI001C8FCDA5|nr:exocyst complex component 6B-like [Amphibalanus amphitrite]XP_043232075.1 exocyst complex component 6B-like [Amphibalanus amphitrite]XP_043232076.1 exocyst complex component 6B-like [Amphibalanus amphitrite]XP_043232078.1 exocyst complex component 6B-like [Amphibalanus amphitrite]XP_043232079.1 exocyst complex component 6B-like [Amphibalanus amphitrite]XP_043232080.1 exocyst complex component 6B-like [Amphibalanus amphitrite]XP_043232081.1 exocyst complex component 6B-like [Amphibalanus am